jgi:hypothetical protein
MAIPGKIIPILQGDAVRSTYFMKISNRRKENQTTSEADTGGSNEIEPVNTE